MIEHLTYAELAERLGVTAEAARSAAWGVLTPGPPHADAVQNQWRESRA